MLKAVDSSMGKRGLGIAVVLTALALTALVTGEARAQTNCGHPVPCATWSCTALGGKCVVLTSVDQKWVQDANGDYSYVDDPPDMQCGYKLYWVPTLGCIMPMGVYCGGKRVDWAMDYCYPPGCP